MSKIKKAIKNFDLGLYSDLLDENSLIIKRLREKKFTDDQIADVLECFTNICKECFDYGSGCQCWNDE